MSCLVWYNGYYELNFLVGDELEMEKVFLGVCFGREIAQHRLSTIIEEMRY